MTYANLNFDLTDPEGLAFDDSPDDFVDLGLVPVVFKVRGIAYFKPRFEHIAIPIGSIRTAAQFMSAYDKWMTVEMSLLAQKIDAAAANGPSTNAHKFLQAVMRGDLELAEKMADRLERFKRTKLRVVNSGL